MGRGVRVHRATETPAGPRDSPLCACRVPKRPPGAGFVLQNRRSRDPRCSKKLGSRAPEVWNMRTNGFLAAKFSKASPNERAAQVVGANKGRTSAGESQQRPKVKLSARPFAQSAKRHVRVTCGARTRGPVFASEISMQAGFCRHRCALRAQGATRKIAPCEVKLRRPFLLRADQQKEGAPCGAPSLSSRSMPVFARGRSHALRPLLAPLAGPTRRLPGASRCS